MRGVVRASGRDGFNKNQCVLKKAHPFSSFSFWKNCEKLKYLYLKKNIDSINRSKLMVSEFELYLNSIYL